MFKKLLALCLASAMLAAAAGCAGTRQEQSAGPAGAQAESGHDNPNMPKVGPYPAKQVWNMASIQLTEGRDYNNPEDDYTMFFRNTFNFEWDMISTATDVEEKIRIWAYASDLPDYATFSFNYVDYLNFAEQGLIKKMPDDWKTKWPGLASASDVSVIGPMLEDKVGGAYGLPKPIFYDLPNKPLSSHSSVWIRTDYLNELNIEVKNVYTTTELLDIAQQMKDSNVSGLGQRFIPIEGGIASMTSTFIGPYNAYHNRFQLMDNGRYEWGGRLEGTWTGLQKYKDAYDRGLLNGDFMSHGGEQDRINLLTGLCGMFKTVGDVGNANVFAHDFTKNTGIQWKEALTWITQINEDGVVRERESINFWTMTIFSPKIEQAKFERIMDFLNFTTHPEVQLFIRMGFEGEDRDWHRDANGEIIVHRPTDENGNFLPISTLYPAAGPMYGNATILSDDFGLKNPGVDAYLRSITKRNYDMKQIYGGDKGTIELTDWYYQFFNAPNFERMSIIYDEAYAQIVTAPGDLRANYDKWLSDNKAMIDLVVEELNAGL